MKTLKGTEKSTWDNKRGLLTTGMGVDTFKSWCLKHPNDKFNLIIIVTGNPGIAYFYSMFMQYLHIHFDCPVWVIGHSGHEWHCYKQLSRWQMLKYALWPPKDTLYNLEQQIQHKLDVVKTHVPKNVNVHLIGHSIGAYIILQMLKDPTISHVASKITLLYPTIYRMAESANGRFLLTYGRPMVIVLAFLSWIFICLPRIIQRMLLMGFFIISTIPSSHYKAFVQLIHPLGLRNIFHMAFDEMDKVRDVEHNILVQHSEKIELFYNCNDGWMPNGTITLLEKCNPIRYKLFSTDFNHAFVLKQQRHVAAMLCH